MHFIELLLTMANFKHLCREYHDENNIFEMSLEIETCLNGKKSGYLLKRLSVESLKGTL